MSAKLLCLLLPLIVEGCKARLPEARLKEQNLASENLPPAGTSSLLDQIIALNQGSIPFPYESLVDLIKQYQNVSSTTRPHQLLVPLGRSLARGSADIYLPRVITSFTHNFGAGSPSITVKDDKASLAVEAHIFTGYAERSRAIEVISYNSAAGRFEFQEIRGYAEGETPHIVYARRERCLPCHQGGGPIFSRIPWLDTNDSLTVSNVRAQSNLISFLKKAITGSRFHGVNMSVADAPSFDGSVRQAEAMNMFQHTWREVCGGLGDKAAQCRHQLLAFSGPGYFFLSPEIDPRDNGVDPLAALQGDDNKRLRTFADFLLANGVNHLTIPSTSFLTDNKGLLEAAQTAGVPKAINKRGVLEAVQFDDILAFTRFARDHRSAEEDAPTTPRPTEQFALQEIQMDSMRTSRVKNLLVHGFFNLVGRLDEFQLFEQVRARQIPGVSTTDLVAARLAILDLPEMQELFQQPVLRRLDYLNILFKLSRGSEVKLQALEASVQIPAAQLEPNVERGVDIEGPKLPPARRQVLRHYLDYCGGCHSVAEDPQMGFLAGRDEIEMWQSLQKRRDTIQKRLAWATEGKPVSGSSMPPKASEAYQTLSKQKSLKNLATAMAQSLGDL